LDIRPGIESAFHYLHPGVWGECWGYEAAANEGQG